MGKFKFSVMFILVMFTVCGCALTAGSIKVTGENDSLEDKIKVSTFDYDKKGFLLTNPLRGGDDAMINTGEYHFIGYIDKKTGGKDYELRTTIRSSSQRYWKEARFMLDNKMTKITTNIFNSETRCISVGCSTQEGMGLMLKRETLNLWANSTIPIQVRYVSQDELSNIDVMINPKEVSAFLEVMDKGK